MTTTLISGCCLIFIKMSKTFVMLLKMTFKVKTEISMEAKSVSYQIFPCLSSIVFVILLMSFVVLFTHTCKKLG